MQIKELQLVNIRSYKSEIINFPSGSCLLAGDIGAGKSTILLAIEFALFGLRRKHLTGSALLRKGAKLGEVELTFSLNDKEIVIKRILKKTRNRVEQSSGFLIINNIKQDLTAVELKAKVLELLNYPMELLTKTKNLIYTYTVYTPQEEMKAILTEDADVRLDVLRKVFGFNKYKIVRENCQIAFKEIRNKIKVFEGSTADLGEKKQFESQFKEQKKLLKKELDKTEDTLKNIKTDFENKTLEMQVLDKQKQELQDLKKNLTNCEVRFEERGKNKKLVEGHIKSTEEELGLLDNKIKDNILVKPLSNKNVLEKELKQKEELIFTIINQENAAKNKLLFLEDSIKSLEQEISGLINKSEEIVLYKSRLESLEKELMQKQEFTEKQKELEQKFLLCNSNVQGFKLKKETAQETIEKVSRLENCPLCLQQVSHVHKDQIRDTENKKIFGLNKELNKLFSEKSLCENDLNKTHEFLKQLAKKELEANKLKINIEMFDSLRLVKKNKLLSDYKIQRVEFTKKLEEIQQNNIVKTKVEIDTLKEQLKLWQKYEIGVKEKEDWEKRIESLALTKVKQQEQLAELEKELINLELKKKDFLVKIESYQELEMNFKLIKEELENLNKIEKELIAKQASQVKGVSSLEEQLSLLKTEINKKDKDKKDMNRLSQVLNWLNKSFVPLTITIERHIMAHVYQLFNELFKKWLNMLVEDDLLSVNLDQDFTPIISQNGFDVEYSHLSGGEKTSIALAYRLALNKVVNDLYQGIGTHDLIILDEPTDGFSREHLDKLRDVFDELNMAQLIIVSHENKIESFVEHVIRVGKSEHVSVVCG